MIGVPVEGTTLPRQALYRGRKVRILEYISKNRFLILAAGDERRIVSREDLTFVKGKKK